MRTLEDYFEFLGPNSIRIKGHRINIEHVLDRYREGRSPEQIAEDFPTLQLEEVYATILYYLQNREQVEDYLSRLDALVRQRIAEADAHPAPVARRLRQLWREREQAPQP